MSNRFNQLNQRISNLYALVGESSGGGGGSQNLDQVLTIGNDAGGQSITNVNDIDVVTINGSAYPPVTITPALEDVLTSGNTATNSISLNNSAIIGGTNVIRLLPNASTTNPNITLTDGTITNTIDKNGMSGNAGTATTATTATNIATTGVTNNQAYYLPFVATQTTSASQGVLTDSNGHITFNPSTNQLTTSGTMVNNGMTMNGSASQIIINNNSAVTPAISAPNAQLISFPNANVTATTFTGALSGTATNATNAVIGTDNVSTIVYPTFVTTSGAGNKGLFIDDTTTPITFNPSTGNLTTTTFTGALSGTASSASAVTTTSDDTSGSYYLPFTKTTAGTNKPLYVDDVTGPLTYNPSTSTLNANNLTGNGSVAVSTGTQMSSLVSNISFSYVSGLYTYFVFNNTAITTTIVGATFLCDLLLVGGGGGGGYNGTTDSAGGGGGAGGYTLVTGVNLISNTYTIAIGTGGAGASASNPGSNGNPTTGFSYTALGGGGGGGGASSGLGLNGGSGGGGSANGVLLGANNPGVGGTSNAAAPSVGFSGGNGLGFGGGGGGGGAGAVGSIGGTTSTLFGGAGGIGSNSVSSWLSAINTYTGTNAMTAAFKTATNTGYIAGGGGGSARNSSFAPGLGGTGGGGNGIGTATSVSAGVINTGGGGGGGSFGAPGQSGGSGLLVIRALTTDLPAATPITATLTATGLSFNSITPNILITANLPTSNAGLPTGTIYRDGASANAFLKIV